MEEEVEVSEEKDAEAREEFYKFITKAKRLCKDYEYEKALKYYTKALEIHYSSKLEKKIGRLKQFIEEMEDSDDDDDDDDKMYLIIDGFKIYKSVWEKLYPHQQTGVKWLWKLYCQKKGGILGDDMGLGKTIQIIAFLSGMFDAELIKYALIVMPVSVMANWRKEFEKWAPGIRLAEFHGAKGKREKDLAKLQSKDGVVFTTYGMIVSNYQRLGVFKDRKFTWDYIILDEGHKIKNATKTSKCTRSVPAENHFILTGTPIQNNLMELWSLMDFVTEGKLLGTSKTFKSEFENPIVRARERDATSYEKKMGNQIAETLRNMIKPYFLQRTKREVFATKSNKEDDENDPLLDNNNVCKKQDIELTKKKDLIIWLYLSDIQLQIYKDFLELDNIREAMNSVKSPLADLTMLKKIADHPRLLSAAACEQLGLSQDLDQNEDVLLVESVKLQFTLELVKDLKKNDHRALIFSQSRKMLDIIDKILTRAKVKLMRFDGRIIDPMDRQKLIDDFQNDSSYICCLLTTQVGAVGLNLTGADRVIIFDPSWNPGNDAQAVDRAYRIGQRKDVTIYRLITCGTIEEKIYRKQIFKLSLSNQTTGTSKNPYRYFARNELRDLFILENPRECITYGILEELHGKQINIDTVMGNHFQFLRSLDIYGISDHSLVNSTESSNAEENSINDPESESQILQRAKRAEEMVTSEINICDKISELTLNEKTIRKQATEMPNKLPLINKTQTDNPVPTVLVKNSSSSPIFIAESPNLLHESTNESIASKSSINDQLLNISLADDQAIVIPESPCSAHDSVSINSEDQLKEISCIDTDENIDSPSIKQQLISTSILSGDEDFYEVADVGCSPIINTENQNDDESMSEPLKSIKSNLLDLTSASPNKFNLTDERSIQQLVDIESEEKASILNLDVSSKNISNLDKSYDVQARRSFHWSAVSDFNEGEKELEGSYLERSGSLFSHSVQNEISNNDFHLMSSMPTQPVPENLEIFSEKSDSFCSFIPDVDAKEADTVLLDGTPNSLNAERMIEEQNSTSLKNHSFEDANTENGNLTSAVSPVGNQSLYRSFQIIESASDNDDYDSNHDNDSSDSDPEIVISTYHGISHATENSSETEYKDEREPKINIESEDTTQSDDETESEDEVLIRSRKSLRRSILSKPMSSPIHNMMTESFEFSPHNLSLDPQETDTVPVSDSVSPKPLYVWDKPFYKRTPGKPSKDPADPIKGFSMADTVLLLKESDSSSIHSSEMEEIPQHAMENESETEVYQHSNNFRIKEDYENLNSTQRKLYRKFITKAEDCREINDNLTAIDYYLEATDICDNDLNIQQTVCLLSKQYLFD